MICPVYWYVVFMFGLFVCPLFIATGRSYRLTCARMPCVYPSSSTSTLISEICLCLCFIPLDLYGTSLCVCTSVSISNSCLSSSMYDTPEYTFSSLSLNVPPFIPAGCLVFSVVAAAAAAATPVCCRSGIKRRRTLLVDGAPQGPRREPQPRPHGCRGLYVLRRRCSQGRARQRAQQVRSGRCLMQAWYVASRPCSLVVVVVVKAMVCRLLLL